jgi:hypothetical protein
MLHRAYIYHISIFPKKNKGVEIPFTGGGGEIL